MSDVLTNWKRRSCLLRLAAVCRTDAAVGPDGVVVLLRHTGVTVEAVVGPHWFLYLRRRKGKTEQAVTVCVSATVWWKENVSFFQGPTMQEVQNILGSRQPASANTNTF